MSMNGMFDEKPEPVTVTHMIACVCREITMRKSVYPKWVREKRMKQASADTELRVMQAVHDLLVKLDGAAEAMTTAELGPRTEMPNG